MRSARIRVIRHPSSVEPAGRVRRRPDPDPYRSTPVPNGWTAVDGAGVELDLPTDFRRTAARGRQEWTGADNSRIAILSGGSMHSGWTGGISSECDVFVSGARTHIDVANASVYARDFVVHGYLEIPGKPAMVVEAHARSRARQAALLHALRTVRILPTWGVQ